MLILCPISAIAKGRPKIRWENDVVNYLKVMTVNKRIIIVQNREIWKENIVEKAKTFNET